MLYISIILLAIAAVWGIYLATAIMGGKKLGSDVVLGHGIVAAVGLIVWIIATATLGFVLLSGLSIALFVLAAIVGVAMYLGKPGPTPQFIGLHAVLAVAGFILLLVYAFASKPA